MKAVNEGAMLVAQALEKLKYFKSDMISENDREDDYGFPEVEQAIQLLQSAVDKLVEKL